MDRFIEADDERIVVPWQTGGNGALMVLPVDHIGPLPKDAPLLQAHKDALTAFALAPFGAPMVATASREQTVKLWSLPPFTDKGVVSEHASEPSVSIVTGMKRIESLCWHRGAAGILAASGGENVVKVLDATAGSTAHELTGLL